MYGAKKKHTLVRAISGKDRVYDVVWSTTRVGEAADDEGGGEGAATERGVGSQTTTHLSSCSDALSHALCHVASWA